MNCNPQKFFVIVGNPHSGKTKTIQSIFKRKNFFPFKQPINVPWLHTKKFVVINSSDFNFRSSDHLGKIRAVVNLRIGDPVSFVTPLSICFDGSPRDISDILVYLNYLDIETHHLVLCSSWFDKNVIGDEVLERYRELQHNGTIHLFEKLVTNSPLRFEERTNEVIQLISSLLNNKTMQPATSRLYENQLKGKSFDLKSGYPEAGSRYQRY
ncbi:hypothetical protein J2T02_000550 [Chitinophaga terrae (ex Kim and Jung 2007)]|uniref:hypothetical protein n=1 Tax=Chitinophaga terrae (ex Kim and Jung 2007) TaxID=408074 RepID=UPI002789C629|nr:hypothetical protein [Chitinophaga terrae (ex Kim and Jung 2007)]MDQ0105457.1 hypothetical protein [Chitinophaga terrae (ex Kim and Jung 2007)]